MRRPRSDAVPQYPLAVLFDVDGTLVDNHAHHEEAWIEWGRRHGHPIDTAFYREHLYARSNDRILRTLLGDQLPPEVVDVLAAEKEGIYRERYAPHLQPMPGLVSLLAQLRELGVPCAAASNAERVNVDFVVDGLGLRGYFGCVLAREDVARGKPDPEIFLMAAVRLGVDPARCCVFEDSAAGFEAARRARMAFVAITGPSRPLDMPEGALASSVDFAGWTYERLVRVVDGGRGQ